MPADASAWQIVGQLGGNFASGLAVVMLGVWALVRITPTIKDFVQGLIDEIGAGRRAVQERFDSIDRRLDTVEQRVSALHDDRRHE